jgi:hypothetical protein
MRRYAGGLMLLLAIVIGAGPAWAADGDVIDGTGPNPNSYTKCWKSVDAAVAIGNGVWVDARAFRSASLHTFGTFVATVQVRGSNSIADPGAANHEIAIGADITTATLTFITTLPVRWLKVRVSAYTSGTVNAYLCATAQ